ncbi:MAG: hypothetical protein ACJZ83_04995 [Pseudohongiellaceae bacterium]
MNQEIEMLTVLKIAVFLTGGLFLVIGLAGLFTPEEFASGLGLSLASAEGAGSVRAMIGAHYLAMAAVSFFAMLRQQPVLLLPIAAIESVMVIARGVAVVNGEFGSATIVPTVIEVTAAAILFMAASRLPASH